MTQSDSHKVTSFPQMPCKLEEDYSEYDDPDDFFPETPTRVPWFSINCGTQHSTSDGERHIVECMK